MTVQSVIMRGAPPRKTSTIAVKQLGTTGYEPTWRAMQAFTRARTAGTRDELWLVQHTPVYTLGIAAASAHLPRGESGIPVVHTGPRRTDHLSRTRAGDRLCAAGHRGAGPHRATCWCGSWKTR